MSEYLDISGEFAGRIEEPRSGWIGESEKGTPFIRIPLVVTEGPYLGQTITGNMYLSPGAFDNTIKALARACQFDGDLAGLATGRKTLAGRDVHFTTEMETYEGKERCKMKWLNPPGGGGSKPMDAVKLKSIIGALQSKSLALAKNAGAPALTAGRTTPPAPAATAAAAGAPAEDDDVPF